MSLTSPFNRAPFGPRGGQFDFRPPEHVRYWDRLGVFVGVRG
jgi:hypothetical protein